MQTRPLGKSGIKIPMVMLGGNVFGWTVDEATSFRILDRAVEAGVNAIDTADVYSKWVDGHQGGESETIIGKWLKETGNRSRVVIATKVGMELAPDRKGLSAQWIERAVEDSLRRLQTDYIDLYQAHRDDTDTPLEETLGAFARLIKAGKVRAIGASNYTASRLAEALKISETNGLPRCESLQPHYNLIERGLFETELRQVCLDNNLGVIPYYALASGFLTGKYRSTADLGNGARAKRAESYLNDRGLKILSVLDTVAARHDARPGEIAIAWLAAQPGITAPIASATSLQQLDELASAANLNLTQEDILALNEVSGV
jgi:aryl-alcohol dehydrogenase-like predicted oxidoreductase